MTERAVFEYLVNSLWQLPLLVAATWLVIRIARPTLLVQHLLWLAALAFAVLLPLHGASTPAPATPPQTDLILINPRIANVDHFPIAEPTPITLHDRIQTISSVRITNIALNSRVIHWIVLLYAAAFAFSLLRLVLSWRKTLALRAASVSHPLTALESSLLHACAERLHLKHLPELRFLTDTHASPMVIGIRQPVLLLPETLRHTANSTFDDHALAAILAHELAHIRRRDFLVNLLARIVALPIAYHPATHAIHRRIRQTREMICDAHAAGTLASPALYARSLLSLAGRLVQQQPVQPQPALEAVGLFDHTRNASTLEERIMHLTAPKLPLSLVRIAAGTAILIAATCTAAAFHLTPATPPVYAAQIQQAAPTLPQPPAPAALPTPPAAPSQTLAPIPPAPPAPAPAPQPAPAPRHARAVVHGEVRDLTPQEQEKLDRDLAAANQQLSTLSIKINDLKLPKIDLSQLKVLDSPEFQKQFAELKVNSPEFQKSMAELKMQLNSPTFKQQLQLTQRIATDTALHSAEIKRDLDNVRIQIDSPEFQKQIAEAKTQALQSRSQMAETRKQLAEASKALAEARKSITDANIQRQLDEAQRHIDNATKK